MNGIENKDESAVPLCVDLDGTLLKTDIFLETLILNIRQRPILFLIIPWLVYRHGISYVKNLLSTKPSPQPHLQPFNQKVLDLILTEKKKGRPVYLVTAASSLQAQAVANRFGVFDGVFASGKDLNLKSGGKRDFLVSRFGEQGYDYVGNALADIPVWEHARKAWLAAPTLPLSLYMAFRKPSWEKTILPSDTEKPLAAWLKELRLHQWIKNILLFVPLFCSHSFHTGDLAWLLLAFLLFGICASSIYLFNDLFDLESDRENAHKKHRPLAAGNISLFQGIAAAGLGAVLSLTLSSLLLPPAFTATLAVYFIANTLYSFFLKKIPLYDVFCLAVLYTLRIVAGGFLLDIHLSYWLLLFSGTFFLGLAFLKRYAELLAFLAKENQTEALPGRGYGRVDTQLMQTMGIASAFIACLVLALYTHSQETSLLYTHQTILGLLCPLFLLWCCRLWIIANRGEMHHDPVVFAMTDKPSYLVCLMACVIVYAAQ